MHRHRRQQTSDPLALPTGISGISGGAVTASKTVVDTQTLVYDSSVTGNPQGTAPALAPTVPITLTTSAPQTTPTPEPSSSSSTSSASDANLIPLSTVIGVCIAAFVGATGIILVGWWLYKRSSRNYKSGSKRRKSRAFLTDHRNARGEYDRSKSRTENWAKLEDGHTKWEDEYQTKELEPLGPMEKLNMFDKASSFHSVGKDSTLTFPNHPYSVYQSNLPEEQAEASTPQFLGRVDTGLPISWGDKLSAANDPLLAIRSSHLTPAAMSPTRSIAIPTPQVVSTAPHRWESAQVMDYDEELASSEAGKTTFGDRELESRDKGKGRAQDPFADQFAVHKPRLPVMHVVTPSSSSIESKERALQSLIAALDISPEQVEERLRVASFQASIHSASSYLDEEDVTSEFPLPPR